MLNNPKARQFVERVLPWLAFSGMLVWGWRVWDIWNKVPAYGDVLEIIWGINWYYDSLVVRHGSPEFTPLVFHPLGWHVFTFGYTPIIFLIGLALRLVGGAAFAFNVLTLASVVIAFAGAQRFARLYTGQFAACIAALVFTFSDFRFFRVTGHLNLALMTAFLPWFLWSLERLRRNDVQHNHRRLILLCGILWGAMINSALHGIFFGVLCFALWGRDLLRFNRLKQAVMITLVALLSAAPVILLYYVGNRADVTMENGPGSLQAWSASLNSLFIPSIVHPIEPIRSLARTLYSGPQDESGLSNIGLVTTLLAIGGGWLVIRRRGDARRLFPLAAVGLILALGLVLRWNGRTIPIALFTPLEGWLWRAGIILKPDIFNPSYPPTSLATGLPLPGYIATIVAPFWESARVISRYTFIGGFAMIILAAIGLQHLGRVGRLLVACVWLLEALPVPTASLPVITHPHPAFTWIAQQTLTPGEGIVDMAARSLAQGGEVIYATQLHRAPTAAIIGSSWPKAVMPLWTFFGDEKNLARPSAALMLEQYHVRYILFHMRGPQEQERWDLLIKNPMLLAKGCFEPIERQSPWSYPICIAEVARTNALGIKIGLTDGWSVVEPWGVWADHKDSWAGWIATSTEPVYLAVEAQPNCQPDQQQEMVIKVNGIIVQAHQWETCTPWKANLPVPANAIQRGWNTITFQFRYEARQSGVSDDERTVAVAFTHLSVEPVTNP